ncbi:hypothetical protein D7X88_11220 [bacterium C-53]|nr:hypothetical protein [Lachnospiraceae bacterium]NBI03606.1 hypothetical protein [Lachnospiraceae bacterium]RKJ09374.1 hypothetical protein D7X88_11220 [bacterium C-53]
MREKQKRLRIWICLLLALSWGMVYPRMALVEGVCRIVDQDGKTISGNHVQEKDQIFTCGSERIRIRFRFQDLNN